MFLSTHTTLHTIAAPRTRLPSTRETLENPARSHSALPYRTFVVVSGLIVVFFCPVVVFFWLWLINRILQKRRKRQKLVRFCSLSLLRLP